MNSLSVGRSPEVLVSSTIVVTAEAGKQLMLELVRTNDVVIISLIESLLTDSGINHLVLDQHMSVIEGSVGMIARRIMVSKDQNNSARRLLKDAGLENYLITAHPANYG